MKGTNVSYKDGDRYLTISFCLSSEFNKKTRPFFSKLERNHNLAVDIGKLYFSLLKEPVGRLSRQLDGGGDAPSETALSSADHVRLPRHISGINTLMVRIELPKDVRDILSPGVITTTAKSPFLVKGVEDLLKERYDFK